MLRLSYSKLLFLRNTHQNFSVCLSRRVVVNTNNKLRGKLLLHPAEDTPKITPIKLLPINATTEFSCFEVIFI